ncbi:MAG TPA: tRNA epoxyqueuosine(34) reductase QueG, partial [Opitutus sp.]|nr:tRNA epoxyqueuosine(34) reductase QueG [Opitutus sp.]
MTRERQEELRGRLRALGFDDVRFAATAEAIDRGALRAWLDAGRQADMAWMERTAAKRLDPERVLAGVKSVILLGVNYWSGKDQGPRTRDQEGGKHGRPVWARYALHEDYHDTIKPALAAAGRVIEELGGARGEDYRYYVDTGPVLERSWAARAGIGFVGKNAMLISRAHGNWLFLAAIFTRLEFAPDEPLRGDRGPGGGIGLLCGKCTRCMAACPTEAFAGPGVLDARRCISYQTIENKGVIPRELRAGIGDRVYGCDVCLEVCPWNRFAQEGRRLLLVARGDLAELEVREILALTPERFAEVFRRTAIKRLKLPGLLRNACVVAGNSGDASLLPAVAKLATHASALVRAHAVWAVFRLGGSGADEFLREARAAERDPAVLAEYAAGQGGSETRPT